MEKSDFNDVLNGGYCIGCGACQVLLQKDPEMTTDAWGRYQPISSAHAYDPFVCPFSSLMPNEDSLAEEYLAEALESDAEIGRFLACYAGFVQSEELRSQSTSGGLTTWIAAQLLSDGTVDKVIHVKPVSGSETPLFAYAVSENIEELSAGAKTRYYPVELSAVMQMVQSVPGKYLVIGLPCFIKAVRLLCEHSPMIRERIAFTIGLFCGTLKTARFTDLLGWQAGIAPGNVAMIDFRDKKGIPDAGTYVSKLTSQQGESRKVNWRDAYGTWWGHGYNKYPACDYCDDVLSETADVSVGDAWLPMYRGDPKGTNIVVARSRLAKELLEKGMNEGSIYLDPLTADEVRKSQASNYRHRRDGLAYRLYLKDKRGLWRPEKRVKAGKDHLTSREQKIYKRRTVLTEKSLGALEVSMRKNDLGYFVKVMERYRLRYELLYTSGLKHWLRYMVSLFCPSLLVNAWLRKIGPSD